MVKAKLKKITRLVGAVALAKELGVTREHLRKVVIGERVSPRITRELKRRGIKVQGVK